MGNVRKRSSGNGVWRRTGDAGFKLLRSGDLQAFVSRLVGHEQVVDSFVGLLVLHTRGPGYFWWFLGIFVMMMTR